MNMITRESDNGFLPESLPPAVRVVTAPIDSVCVSEDRAEICRAGDISWIEGPQAIYIVNVTVFAHDPSLNCRIEGFQTPIIGNARMLRYYVAPGSDHRVREEALLKKLDTLADRYLTMVDERQVARHKMDALNKALQEAREGIIQEVVHHGKNEVDYQPRVKQLFSRLSELMDGEIDSCRSFRDLLEQIEMLIREAQEDPELVGKRAGVLINFESSQSGSGRLVIRYEVPCAQWRPYHEAHLLEVGPAIPEVMLITHGAVWQKTGEDWSDVELTLSTARPSLGLNMPLPAQDFLKVRNKTPEERKQIRVATRDQVVRDTGLDPGSSPGVPDDGGNIQKYSPPGRVGIPADGRPYMVELGRSTSESHSSLVAAPELCDRVFLRSRLKAGDRPILAGPVELYRQGGFVGRGFLEFVGPGESYHLYWGSEDFLELIRWVDQSSEEGGVVSKPRLKFTVNLLIRNLNDSEAAFELTERIPVSELEQVKVEIKELPGKAQPDRDGFVRVDVSLAPQSEQKLTLKYVLVMNKNVVL